MAWKPLRSTVNAPSAGSVKVVRALVIEAAKPFNAVRRRNSEHRWGYW